MEPAKITIILAHTGRAQYALFPASSSIPFSIPAILLNPPRGIALIEYIVSPFFVLTNLGPKPIANSSTRIPVFFAVIKCPNS